MPLTIPRSFALAVSAFALAGLVVGPAGQGEPHEVVRLEGKRSTVFLRVAVDLRRSPTGRIAFSAGAHPHEDVYVVNADGSGLRRLTDDPGPDFDPSWSPDGRWIAYRHEGEGGDSTAEIYVMDADGSQKRNLTRRPG
jgi:Tol biopolymer transport system component